MALVVADRVKETTTTTGTGTITLAGAATGFRSFSVVGNGNTTYYTIAGQTGGEWEVGIGTYTSSGTTLSRDTVLASSNSGSLVVFSAGTKDVFVTYPAGYSVATQFANTFTSNQVISDNSSNAALRITQVGAGNALLVEDSANPDSTPFVVDASGFVYAGYTGNAGSTATSLTPGVQFVGYGASVATVNQKAAFGTYRFYDDTSGPSQVFFKSRSGTPGTFLTVASGDNLGNIFWQGDDGTSFPRAASIAAAVDGTPGTNDMPGRLVFSTTADGAATPTERMRIDNAGNVGFGAASSAGRSVSISKNLTGNTVGINLFVNGVAQSDVTGSIRGVSTSLQTAAASFTATEMVHFYANQSTIGLGSSVTNQFGYFANSTLTGATNNYGFYSNIASGTGRWNFYAAGTAANYFAGTVQVAAVVESTSGGFKFPDGTTQTSAGASTGKAIAFSMILGG